MDVFDPEISRKISCPANATFQDLHRAIQIAFGWVGYHHHAFQLMGDKINGTYDQAGEQLHLSSDLIDIGLPNIQERDERDVKLCEILENRKWTGKADTPRFIYEYDFGDSWEHACEILGRAKKTSFFECIAGEGHPCAEDAGAPPGWEALKDCYRAKRKDREQKELIEWYETCCANGDPRGLAGNKVNQWPQKDVNAELRRMKIVN